jgi:hypothetical protein
MKKLLASIKKLALLLKKLKMEMLCSLSLYEKEMAIK